MVVDCTVSSDAGAGESTTLAEDHDATITGDVAFHQILTDHM